MLLVSRLRSAPGIAWNCTYFDACAPGGLSNTSRPPSTTHVALVMPTLENHNF